MTTIFNYFPDNNLVLFATIPFGILVYFIIKSHLNYTVNQDQIPQSPQTFNFTQEQLKELQDTMDRGETSQTPQPFSFTHEELKKFNDMIDKGEKLPADFDEKLDQHTETIMGKDLYTEFKAEEQKILDEFQKGLDDILNNMDNFL